MRDMHIGTADYVAFLTELKQRILSARLGAERAVNSEVVLLYWDIGRRIMEKQAALGWGQSVVELLARDLQKAFPGTKGFSPANLWRMRQFYATHSAEGFLAQVARDLLATVPWWHHVELLAKVKDPKAHLYYLRATARFGWSRSVLLNQIKGGAYERALTERKTHNFDLALPEHHAEQAEEALKSSYNLEFLGIGREVRERELEGRLLERLRDFILELGYGFCFIGNQYRLTLGDKEYFIDLLFYHRFLKALVAVELKVGHFQPEFAGKMDFYLNLLNEKEKAVDDRLSIGIILCAEKDNLEVEFSLKTKTNPIGVAEYRLVQRLPRELKGKLPNERQLAAALKRAITVTR